MEKTSEFPEVLASCDIAEWSDVKLVRSFRQSAPIMALANTDCRISIDFHVLAKKRRKP